jgi:hypothetical protein
MTPTQLANIYELFGWLDAPVFRMYLVRLKHPPPTRFYPAMCPVLSIDYEGV